MIDLLPDTIRTRSESGMVIGRYATIGVLLVVLLVALSTHAHFRLERVELALKAAEEKSRLVLVVEAEAKRLRDSLNEVASSIEQYERVAPSLNMTDLQALVTSQIPESVALERLDMEVAQVAREFDPRVQTTEDEELVREIRAELGGFARSDADVAELVARLSALEPLSAVSLDSSKSRTVREQSSREFRLSFEVNLERRYEVAHGEPAERAPEQVASGEGANDVE